MNSRSFRILLTFVLSCLPALAQQRSWFSNLSFLTPIGPDENPIIGFAVGGDPDQKMEFLIRVAGPSLPSMTSAMIADTHPDPKLEVYAPSGQLVLTNDQWDETIVPDPSGRVPSVIVNQNLLTGFTFPRGSKDAAVVLELGPGMQTVQIKPADGRTRGTVLFEIYSRVRAHPPPVRLTNLSVRTTVGPGRVPIIGVAMEYPRSDREPESRAILLRSIGPGLAQFGITTFNPSPRIEMYTETGIRGTIVNQWEMMLPGAPADFRAEQLARFNRAHVVAGAFPLQPGSKDAALFFELPPFNWTFHLMSADGSAGEVLFEIYDVPLSVH